MPVTQISIIALIGSLFFLLVLIILLKPKRYQIKAAGIAAAVVALLNFIFEVIAHKLNWYYTSGAVEFLNVPLSLTVMWLFLGCSFCIIYSSIGKLKKPIIARIICIFIGVAGGIIYDTKIGPTLGLVKFEPVFTPFHIFLLWLSFILLTILIYNLLLRKSRSLDI